MSAQRDLQNVLESVVSALPESSRLVLVLRAHVALRRDMENRTGTALAQSFQFHLSRCDRVVEAVFRRIREIPDRSAAS